MSMCDRGDVHCARGGANDFKHSIKKGLCIIMHNPSRLSQINRRTQRAPRQTKMINYRQQTETLL